MIELVLSEAEIEMFERKKAYVKEHVKVKLDEDDIARICHQCKFNEAAIDAKLQGYFTSKKYEGLEEYEW